MALFTIGGIRRYYHNGWPTYEFNPPSSTLVVNRGG